MQAIRASFTRSQALLLLLFPLFYSVAWLLENSLLPYSWHIGLIAEGIVLGIFVGGVQMLFLRYLLDVKLRAWIPVAIIAYIISLAIWTSYDGQYRYDSPFLQQLHAISWYLIPSFAGWLVLRRETRWAWLWAGAGIVAALVDFGQTSNLVITIPTTQIKWLSAPADITYTLACVVASAGMIYLRKNRGESSTGENSLTRFGWFGVGWIGIAVLAYPLGIAIPLAIHVFREQIDSLNQIIWYCYWNAYSEHVMIYMICFTVILAFLQKILLKHFLGFGVPHWFKASVLGGLIGVFCIYKVDTPFLDSLELAPWLFCLSAAQAFILYRYTPKAWLWIVAHVSIAGLFPIRSDGSMIAMIVLWIVAASVAGGLTAIVFKMIQDSIELDDTRKKNEAF